MNFVAAGGDSRASWFADVVTPALRGMRWKQVGAAMLFGLIVTIVAALIFLEPLLELAKTMPMPLLFAQDIVSTQIKALCLLVAIVIADRAVDEGAGRRATYLTAALAGCLAGIVLTEPFNWAYRNFVLPDRWPRPYQHGAAALYFHPVFELTHWLLIGGSAVFLYAGRRAARSTAQRLHAAELDRVRRSKRALESRLQAMQARIEPQFLFNTLAQVERLYELDPARADRMLDDLIAYLRAAMPLMRDTSSTVRQELDLARAYLDIVRIRLGDRLAFAIEIPPDFGDARMPPMMLLPLIDHAIVYGLERTQAAGAIRIDAQVRAGRLRVAIADSGAGFVPEGAGDGITGIRDRLAALYGENARLELGRTGAQTTEAVLDLPLETGQGQDDDALKAEDSDSDSDD